MTSLDAFPPPTIICRFGEIILMAHHGHGKASGSTNAILRHSGPDQVVHGPLGTPSSLHGPPILATYKQQSNPFTNSFSGLPKSHLIQDRALGAHVSVLIWLNWCPSICASFAAVSLLVHCGLLSMAIWCPRSPALRQCRTVPVQWLVQQPGRASLRSEAPNKWCLFSV